MQAIEPVGTEVRSILFKLMNAAIYIISFKRRGCPKAPPKSRLRVAVHYTNDVASC